MTWESQPNDAVPWAVCANQGLDGWIKAFLGRNNEKQLQSSSWHKINVFSFLFLAVDLISCPISLFPYLSSLKYLYFHAILQNCFLIGWASKHSSNLNLYYNFDIAIWQNKWSLSHQQSFRIDLFYIRPFWVHCAVCPKTGTKLFQQKIRKFFFPQRSLMILRFPFTSHLLVKYIALTENIQALAFLKIFSPKIFELLTSIFHNSSCFHQVFRHSTHI